MKRILPILLALLAACPALHASTQITGTLTVTNAANINATNGYTVTVEGDARTLTNAVVDVTTQVLVSTNNATMVQRLLAHFAKYPVTGLSLTSDGSTYLAWKQAVDTALSITLNTNTWAAVSYVTNTTTTNVLAVRVPHTAESAANQTNIASGVMAMLNSAANTNTLNSDKITSLASSQVTWAHAALNVDSAATNFVANLTGEPYRTITATNNIHFIQSTNRPSGATSVRSISVRINPNGSDRLLSFNSNWQPLGAVPTNIVNGTVGVLTVIAFGSAETDVAYAYTVEGGIGSDTDDQTAAEVPFSPAGAIAATDVQAALTEVDSEKVAATRQITVAGTANEIASSAGAQDLSGDRTWTLSLPTSIDLGGKSSLEIPNGASPTVNVFGQIASDNDSWAAGRGAILHYDGTAVTAILAALASDAPSNGQVPKWNTGGTITWEDDSTGAPGSGDDVFVNGSNITHPDIDDGLDIAWTITASTNLTASFARSAAIGSDPALSANHVTIGTTGIVAEGSTADGIETLLTFEDPTSSDKTWTIPNATDTAVGKATTDTFTNKTLDAAATGNVLKQIRSLKFNFPRMVDNTGCTIGNTNNYSLATFMVPQFSGTGATNANYMRFGVRVPDDIDTAVDLTAKLTFELTGADTGAHTYHVGMVSIADSAAIAGTAANFVALSFAGDGSGASGDVESIAATTLTAWRTNMTAGQWWLIELRRDGANDASTVASRFQELEIFYTSTQ
jgi:hypothetical protein